MDKFVEAIKEIRILVGLLSTTGIGVFLNHLFNEKLSQDQIMFLIGHLFLGCMICIACFTMSRHMSKKIRNTDIKLFLIQLNTTYHRLHKKPDISLDDSKLIYELKAEQEELQVNGFSKSLIKELLDKPVRQ